VRVSPTPIAHRITGLRRGLKRRRLAAMLINDPTDVGYLSGFTGDDSWLLAGQGRPWLLTDFRYAEQAEHECPGMGILVRRGAMADALAGLVRRKRLGAVGFDPETMTVMRSEERRVGKECLRKCISRWSPYH
jgi:Xaa-Pro aminopeptidase